MGTTNITILMVSFALLSPLSARVITQNAFASILQDILSPANTDQAMQLINMAASRSNKRIAIPEMARAVACGNQPLPVRTVIASNDYLPARAVVASDMPVRVMASDGYGYARTVANEIPRAIYNPEVSIQKILRQAPVKELQKVQPNLLDSLVMPKEIFQPFSVALPQESIVRPCQALPPAPNPYLPIASPVSATSPFGLPPPIQSKGHFLRKIPIPPPSL